MTLPNVSLSADGFLGMAGVTKAERGPVPWSLAALIPVQGLAGRSVATPGPKLRALKLERGPQVCPTTPGLPTRGAPPLLRATGEGASKPSPGAGAGSRAFQHVPPTARTIRAPGQVAWLPATRRPLDTAEDGARTSPVLPM